MKSFVASAFSVGLVLVVAGCGSPPPRTPRSGRARSAEAR